MFEFLARRRDSYQCFNANRFRWMSYARFFSSAFFIFIMQQLEWIYNTRLWFSTVHRQQGTHTWFPSAEWLCFSVQWLYSTTPGFCSFISNDWRRLLPSILTGISDRSTDFPPHHSNLNLWMLKNHAEYNIFCEFHFSKILLKYIYLLEHVSHRLALSFYLSVCLSVGPHLFSLAPIQYLQKFHGRISSGQTALCKSNGTLTVLRKWHCKTLII